MSEETETPHEQLPLDGAGGRLRRAREEAKMSVEQVAAETRIPQRHIETIEQGDFARLPSRTYAIGFSRSYAKAVGLDEAEIVAQVREELAMANGYEMAAPSRYEPGDPSRVPSGKLAWFAGFAVLLLLAGAFSFYRSYFAPGLGPAPLTDPEAERVAEESAPPERAAPAGRPADPQGAVVFTALEDGIWVKFYDANGTQLMQKQMAVGERYTVPADAEGPQIWTGRPDALRITIGGKPVPKLAEEDMIMRDVPVTAEALLARGTQIPPAPPEAT